MIYTPLTKLAMQIAYNAHHGQQDKGGMPYIFHPYHLAEEMPDEYTTCAALLHDVVEDTLVTLDELAELFPLEVVQAVALLTHHKGTDYLEYVSAIKENPIARTVKLADLRHNSDISRLELCIENKSEIRRFEEKYSKALALLTQKE
jgi:(p)ppGpp synthase/HD superfamily hydrolase